MYILHIKITLHIQILVHYKNAPTHLFMDLPRIQAIYFIQQKEIRWQLLQIKMCIMHYTIWAMSIFE